MMDAVVERSARQSPVTVMARLASQRALEPAWIDALFERECGAQYTRALLFSTVVELMSVVAGSASRLGPLLTPIRQGEAPIVPGYRLRIVDGNHLPDIEQRARVLPDSWPKCAALSPPPAN